MRESFTLPKYIHEEYRVTLGAFGFGLRGHVAFHGADRRDRGLRRFVEEKPRLVGENDGEQPDWRRAAVCIFFFM